MIFWPTKNLNWPQDVAAPPLLSLQPIQADQVLVRLLRPLRSILLEGDTRWSQTARDFLIEKTATGDLARTLVQRTIDYMLERRGAARVSRCHGC